MDIWGANDRLPVCTSPTGNLREMTWIVCGRLVLFPYQLTFELSFSSRDYCHRKVIGAASIHSCPAIIAKEMKLLLPPPFVQSFDSWVGRRLKYELLIVYFWSTFHYTNSARLLHLQTRRAACSLSNRNTIVATPFLFSPEEEQTIKSVLIATSRDEYDWPEEEVVTIAVVSAARSFARVRTIHRWSGRPSVRLSSPARLIIIISTWQNNEYKYFIRWHCNHSLSPQCWW